jgi:hypothetical protein
MRKVQNFENHVHWVPLYHFVTLSGMFSLPLITVYLLLTSSNESDKTILILLLVLSLVVISVSFHCRSFALKVQDRAIRTEENLRHYILTGNVMDEGITLEQIIALRFASDEEFVALTKRALEENLTNEEIKKSIKNWRADYYRA